MVTDLSDFFDEYDELANRVRGARHQDFSPSLRRWFSVLDDAPNPVADRVRWLEGLWTYERVAEEVMEEREGMGSGQLNWPENLEQRLSAQISLFRHLSISEQEDAGWQFSHEYYYTKSNSLDDILHEMTEHLFEPFSSDLRRYLKRSINDPVPAQIAPASDRLVRLDHNASSYTETLSAIGNVEDAVVGNNELEELDRERLIFELRSGKLLMEAQTARIEALQEVLVKCLKWLAAQFAEQTVGIAASAALMLLLRLIGVTG